MSKGRKFKLVRDLFALSGGEVLSKLVGFLAFAFLARRLDPETYGSVEYTVGLSVVFATVVEWGLGPVGVRELANEPQRAATLAADISGARLAIAGIAIPLMGLSTILTGQARETIQLVWLFSLGLLAIPWKQDWLLQGLENMKAAAAAQVIRMTAFASGIVVFVHSSRDLLKVGMVEVVAAGIGAAYYLSLQQMRGTRIRIHFSRAEFQHLIREGLSIGLSNMVWAIIQFAPMYLVASLSGEMHTAWFGASQRIAVSLLTFSQVYHFNLYPALVRGVSNSHQDLKELVGASYRVVAWAGILVALVLTLLARPLLVLAYGEDFALAARTFSVLIWVLPATLLSGHARWALIATGHQRYVLMAHVAGVAAVVGVSAALIPLLGSVGAAIATVSATLVVWAVAHRSAISQIGRLPVLFAALPPVIIAILSSLFVYTIDATPWVAAATAVTLFVLCAPLVDGKLVADLRRLVHAKANLTPQSKTTP